MLLTTLSGPLILQPLGPGTTVPSWADSAPGAGGAGRPRRDIFCRTSTASNPVSDQPQDLPKGLAVRNSEGPNSDALCVMGLAGLCHAAHVSSCCILWSQLVASRSHPEGLQMEVRQSSDTSGGRPYAPEL